MIKTYKILIIDDTEFNRCLIAEIFRSNGFNNIYLAEDGKKGVELTKQHNPDLVILDINMPVMDGFEYCKIIRKIKEYALMPIIVQSATSVQSDLSKAFKLGATDFIHKPINPDELIARSTIHLKTEELIKKLDSYQQRVALELDESRQMQASLMPSEQYITSISGKYNLDIATYFKPSSELSGDLWGAHKLSHNELAIYNVDLTGHGVTAALNTFRVHTLLKEQGSFFSSPALFFHKLNDRLEKLLKTGQYATMFYGVIDIDQNILTYSMAGCTSPVVANKRGEHNILLGEGMPLGITSNIEYDEHQTELHKGDSIILYSDALIETEDKNGQFISTESLAELFVEFVKHDKSSDYVLENIIDGFYEHAESPDLKDDLTISIYKR